MHIIAKQLDYAINKLIIMNNDINLFKLTIKLKRLASCFVILVLTFGCSRQNHYNQPTAIKNNSFQQKNTNEVTNSFIDPIQVKNTPPYIEPIGTITLNQAYEAALANHPNLNKYMVRQW